jgi:hypothetical protein
MNEFQRGVAHLASAIRCLVVFPLGVDLPSLFTADCRLLTCPQRLCRSAIAIGSILKEDQ